jgi:hypothetical protein
MSVTVASATALRTVESKVAGSFKTVIGVSLLALGRDKITGALLNVQYSMTNAQCQMLNVQC